jgi:hypothetical protein
MCGIFGVTISDGSEVPFSLLNSTVNDLFKLSESRGKEASSLAIRTRDTIRVYKQSISASSMIQSKEYKKMFHEFCDNFILKKDRLLIKDMLKLSLKHSLYGYRRIRIML